MVGLFGILQQFTKALVSLTYNTFHLTSRNVRWNSDHGLTMETRCVRGGYRTSLIEPITTGWFAPQQGSQWIRACAPRNRFGRILLERRMGYTERASHSQRNLLRLLSRRMFPLPNSDVDLWCEPTCFLPEGSIHRHHVQYNTSQKDTFLHC